MYKHMDYETPTLSNNIYSKIYNIFANGYNFTKMLCCSKRITLKN